MDIAAYSIQKPVNTWMIVLMALLGGLWGLTTVGRLEDPAFTIKEAQVITQYPGATAAEVETEVTERLETAIQQMPQLDLITSASEPGLSRISVEIKPTYDGSELPQVWDELRRKVNDEVRNLPAGAGTPLVYDAFGDVYGLFYAFTADGYTNRDIRETVKQIRRELLTVEGVGKVEVAGEPEDVIYLNVDQDKIAGLGISMTDIAGVLDAENRIQSNGSGISGDKRIRLMTASAFDDFRGIQDLVIGRPGSTAMIRLSDIATLELGEPERPSRLIRHNGHEAVTIGVSQVDGTNIVEVGGRVIDKLAEVEARLPVGMQIHPIYEQNIVVDESVNGFITNLAASVVIVIAVLALFMGWRAALVVGTVLLLTVMATVLFMRIFNIEMERISLGALIIAMGMLVDNAIVVAEGMMIIMQRGMKAIQAASKIVRQTMWPLLGATVIGIMAFSGIGLSPDATGEFLFSLFAVIGISLILSWVFAITVTPLFGKYFFRTTEGNSDDHDPYKGIIYATYRAFLVGTLHARLLTVAVLVGITVTCIMAFGNVKQAFFPDSNTPLFYVNYWAPQGTDIRATETALRGMEETVLNDERVEAVTSFAGGGASRFMLTYAPEDANPAYGHMIVRTTSREVIDRLALDLREQFATEYPSAQIITKRLVFGPGGGAKIEARFSGPDANVLKRLGGEAQAIFSLPDNKLADVNTDWRQRELVVRPIFDEDRARISGVTREELSVALQFATDGVRVGAYRDNDESLPIVARKAEQDGMSVNESVADTLIWTASQRRYVPVDQVVTEFVMEPQDTVIHRRDRVRTLTVKAETTAGETASAALARVRPQIESISLPPGYSLEWGGEYESTNDAQASLGAQLPLGFLVMLIISILLFGSVRQPLIIWLMVPMSINGVAIALLATDTPFGFMSLLGFLSLSGMLIKNAIVLLEEIDLLIREGMEKYQAIVQASVSRMRPVMLAAITTILGMAPLLSDAFFRGMAVTIMGGLAFATVLTLIAAPVLYALFFRVRPPKREKGNTAETGQPPADAIPAE
ncbi:multidrug efflux pump subunit AcrB [Roseibium hamelinense]|uniref:Multidrug efflux pump subunit AcrB n=1 Tax=Roseibium hamelinense TaxID=150831 RepID=A0A562TII8_9HYPH|nr:efflux RND transporter permease subunit [Roseibium hamelinense]MTI45617.1 efflux RND transporter permease subunit [Roseibium hamelinense]TWI93203.1 multidrug efflux pump subunit AcrB [Roseibium hamelinense]